jgi:hypothetical protein
MSKPIKMFDKKLSLYEPPIKMLPKIQLLAPPHKNIKSGLTFWPEPKDQNDDRLPKSK